MLAVLAAFAALWNSPSVSAISDEEGKLHTGMFGLAPQQTARLNLVHIGDPNENPAPCAAEMVFYDGFGNRLAQSRVQLRAGESALLDLQHQQLGRAGRVQVRAEWVGFNPQPDPPGRRFGKCLGTAEVFDDVTGKTTLVIGNPEDLPPPRR